MNTKGTPMNTVESQLQPQDINLSPPPRSLPRRSFLRRMDWAPSRLLQEPHCELGFKSVSAMRTESQPAMPPCSGSRRGGNYRDRFWVQYNELGGIPDNEVPGRSAIRLTLMP